MSTVETGNMDALRSTINTQSIKTKQVVFQYPDGSFPAPGAVLNVTDTRGHTDWTRAPNLDTITLIDASGNEGIISYTGVSGLLVNNIPVGGGSGSVFGGTNIQISGGNTVNFKPDKTAAGVDMLGAPMTNTSRVGFTTDALITTNGSTAQKAFHTTNATLGITNTQYLIGDYNNTLGMNGGGVKYDAATKLLSVNNPAFIGPALSGQGIAAVGGVKSIVGTNTTELNGSQLIYNNGSKNATLSLNPTSTNGTLELTNTTSDPQLRISTTGAAASITASAEASTKINTIAMATTGGTGTSQITMTDGVANAAVTFNGASDKLNINSSQNLTLTSGPNQAIEMGTLAARLALLTNDNAIRLRRNNAGGAVNKTQLTVEDAGIIQIGDEDVSSNPAIKFQSYEAVSGTGTYGLITFTSANDLDISGTAGAGGTSLKLSVPLRDSSGSVGTAGQVLTAQASGPPLWQAGGGGGGGGGVVLSSQTYLVGSHSVVVNTTNFPGISTSTPTTLRFFSQAGGGGGGGGYGLASSGGIQSGGGGGGGGAGFIDDFFLTVPYGTTLNLTVGAGGAGGNSGTPYTVGAGDGTAGNPNIITAVIGGKTFTNTTPGGGGGGNGQSSSVGGAGNPAGDTAPFFVTGPFTGVNPGANGGGFYSGLAGAGDGSVPSSDLNAGRGIASPPATLLSGAGGGGGGGGAGSNGENGGSGADGFIRINAYSG